MYWYFQKRKIHLTKRLKHHFSPKFAPNTSVLCTSTSYKGLRSDWQNGFHAILNFNKLAQQTPAPFLFVSKMPRIFLFYSLVSYEPQKVCNITKVFTANNTFACLI